MARILVLKNPTDDDIIHDELTDVQDDNVGHRVQELYNRLQNSVITYSIEVRYDE